MSDEIVGRMATTLEKRMLGEARGCADADSDALPGASALARRVSN